MYAWDVGWSVVLPVLLWSLSSRLGLLLLLRYGVVGIAVVRIGDAAVTGSDVVAGDVNRYTSGGRCVHTRCRCWW